MRTEIVYTDNRRHRRATIVTLEHATPREQRGVLPEPVKFEPAHVVPPGRVGYINFNTGKTGSRMEPARKVPDAVRCGSDRYFFERGKCAKVKLVPPMPVLLALADEVMKIHAICTVCGAPATRSQRLNAHKERVLIGETDAYEARCRGHYQNDEAEEQALLPLEEEIKPLAGQLAN